jgi:hypothetical protein
LPVALTAIADAILDGAWHARRAAIVERAMLPRQSLRRRAFELQLAAEAAGYFGDAATCAELVGHVAAVGAFDLPWLDGCPVLDVVRGSDAIGGARAQIARCADAILDALYRDSEDTELPATVVS